MEDTVRYWGEVAGVGAPSWSSADPMQGQDCKITRHRTSVNLRSKRGFRMSSRKERECWVRQLWVQTLATPLISDVTLDKKVALTGASSPVRWR